MRTLADGRLSADIAATITPDLAIGLDMVLQSDPGSEPYDAWPSPG